MSDYILKKRFQNSFGIDLKSSDLDRPEAFASGLKNAQYRKSGSVEKRKGFQAHANSQGGHGLFTYNKVNPITAAAEPEILSISDKGHKLSTSILTVTYTGTEDVATISIFLDSITLTYHSIILAGTVQVLDKDLGVGFDEAIPVTIDALRIDIDALTDFTATVSGATTTPASFIPIIREHDLSSSGGPFTGDAQFWQDLNTPLAAPFAGSETNKNSLDFENVTAVQVNNIMIFSNGFDEVQKYDGQNLYRLGLPNVATLTTALGVAGAITGTDYQHVAQYVQKDAVGNFVEGNILKSDSAALLSPTSETIDVTVANIQDTTGFNTNCGIVVGAQATVNTITVDDGSGGSHTLLVGDTAFFFDAVSAAFVERNIDSVAATTITVAGSPVTVADNAVISNNLRIAIYRNKTSTGIPTVHFLVEEIPNDSFSATQVFNDNVVDASLGAQLIEPLVLRNLPSKGKYISLFRNQAIIAGSITQPDTNFFSDVLSPEFWPPLNQFDTKTEFGDIITGLAPNNELFAVFKKRSIFIVSGNIADGTIRVDQLTNDIGCEAHATITDVRGSLYFLTDRGPYTMTGGQVPIPLGGNRVEPIFDTGAIPEETKLLLFGTQVLSENEVFRFKRAIGFNDRNEERYLLFLPTETETGGDRFANNQSKVLAFDYEREAWLIWDNINAAAGFTSLDEDLYWSERRFSTFNSSVDHIIYRRHRLDEAFDYADNTAVVQWEYDAQWDALGEPAVLKRLLAIQIFGLEEIKNGFLNLNVNTEINYIREVTVSSAVLQFIGDGYGISQYSLDPYGDPQQPFLKSKLSSGRMRAVRFRFSNDTLHENVILSGWEAEFAAPYRAEFKS